MSFGALRSGFDKRPLVLTEPQPQVGRTTKNTRAFPLGLEVGMNWRGALAFAALTVSAAYWFL
jgi:hypothetical protein